MEEKIEKIEQHLHFTSEEQDCGSNNSLVERDFEGLLCSPKEFTNIRYPDPLMENIVSDNKISHPKIPIEDSPDPRMENIVFENTSSHPNLPIEDSADPLMENIVSEYSTSHPKLSVPIENSPDPWMENIVFDNTSSHPNLPIEDSPDPRMENIVSEYSTLHSNVPIEDSPVIRPQNDYLSDRLNLSVPTSRPKRAVTRPVFFSSEDIKENQSINRKKGTKRKRNTNKEMFEDIRKSLNAINIRLKIVENTIFDT